MERNVLNQTDITGKERKVKRLRKTANDGKDFFQIYVSEEESKLVRAFRKAKVLGKNLEIKQDIYGNAKIYLVTKQVMDYGDDEI